MKHKIYSNKTFQVKAKDVALDSLFNLFPINFCWLNKEGYILGFNEQMLYSLKTTDFTDIIGKHSLDIFNPIAWENSKTVIRTGQTLTVEEEHLNEEGNKVFFLSMKSPIKDCDNNTIGIVLIAIDITERKSMEMNLIALKEAAELSDKVKTEFLTNMRHDLRTPLTGICSISEFLENGEQELTRKNYLRDIKYCAESMLSHLNEIIDRVKAETGEFVLVEKEFNIHSVLYDIYQMMQPIAQSKKIDFTLELDHIPAALMGDAARIQRIFMNLISNALKFTQVGFVRVIAKWRIVSSESGVLHVSIEDSGVGIPADKQSIIFEKFHRLHAAHEGVYKGDGLGLNIVKQFLQDIRGDYILKSDLGKGTTFEVKIFCRTPPSTPYEAYKMYCSKSIEELNAAPTVQKKKILLVEDNEIISRISKDILEALNLEVDVARDGKEALCLLDNQYNLVIMDIGLPDISGYQVTKYIRSHQNPIISQVPVIAITAHAEEEERKLAMDAGVNEMFPKPLNQELAKWIKSQVS